MKTEIEIKTKRVKKNKQIERDTTNTTIRNKQNTISNITIRNKQNTISNTKTRTKRNVRTFKITRAATSIFQIINIFSDETSDDSFNDLNKNNSNKKFRISKNGNEVIDNN